MSHTTTDAERSWDYGMVDTDWIAFPICKPAEEDRWSDGNIKDLASYWYEHDWIMWQKIGKINYFRVEAFRSVPPDVSSIKGVTEGSETSITWGATFSPWNGRVRLVSEKGIALINSLNGHKYTWKILIAIPNLASQ